MLTKIELTNFMAHAHTVIEPAAGLTVLVGPNNCGKSAVVAALQILCSNANSTYVMRHGERECSVEVTTSEGHVVRWGRKSSPSYRIDGQLFDRLRGSALPEALHQALRLPEVSVGESASFDIHFGSQKSPIFLLDKPESAAARFFASSSDASRLVEMQKRHKDRLAERQRDKNRLEAESQQLTAELEALSPAPAIDRAMREAEEAHTKLIQLTTETEQAAEDARRLEDQIQQAANHGQRAAALSLLAPPPKMADARPLAGLIDATAEREQIAALSAAMGRVLAALPAPPALADTSAIAECCRELARQTRQQEHTAAEQRALADLPAVPQLDDAKSLERTMSELRQAEQAAERSALQSAALGTLLSPPALDKEEELALLVGQLQQSLLQCEKSSQAAALAAALEPPPPPIDFSRLAELNVRIEAAAAEVERQALEFAATEQSLADAAAALREAAANSVCPLCGSQLDADRLLALSTGGGHAHG